MPTSIFGSRICRAFIEWKRSKLSGWTIWPLRISERAVARRSSIGIHRSSGEEGAADAWSPASRGDIARASEEAERAGRTAVEFRPAIDTRACCMKTGFAAALALFARRSFCGSGSPSPSGLKPADAAALPLYYARDDAEYIKQLLKMVRDANVLARSSSDVA